MLIFESCKLILERNCEYKYLLLINFYNILKIKDINLMGFFLFVTFVCNFKIKKSNEKVWLSLNWGQGQDHIM